MPPQRICCETPPALWLNIKFNFGPVVKAGACACRAQREQEMFIRCIICKLIYLNGVVRNGAHSLSC
jgi:hypothetical protein